MLYAQGIKKRAANIVKGGFRGQSETKIENNTISRLLFHFAVITPTIFLGCFLPLCIYMYAIVKT